MKTFDLPGGGHVTFDDDFAPTPLPCRDAWVAALRSGEYPQGSGVLRTADNRYCALGVLAAVHPQATWFLGDLGWMCNGKYTVLTSEFLPVTAVGVLPFNGFVQHPMGCGTDFTDLSDKGVPFDVLAALVEITYI